mgnify:CR=1 FL=1
MENLRYHEEEMSGDMTFSKKLSKLGTFYVNDAFGTAHRAHASTTIITQFFKEEKCFGSLLEKEVLAIEKVMDKGESPILAILGGATRRLNPSDQIGVWSVTEISGNMTEAMIPTLNNTTAMKPRDVTFNNEA